MPPKHLAHPEHIRESAKLIQQYVSGLELSAFLEDLQTRDAVERRFTIIGEALNRLKRDAPDTHARIGDTAQIAAFRNIIVHVYDQLDHQIVWRVIREDLPMLHTQVVQLLDQASKDE